jgi:hypothetical protein
MVYGDGWYPQVQIRVIPQKIMAMDILKSLEPKYSTLIQASLITILLVLISFVYSGEEKASSERQAVAAIKG